jgi:hypothetical protein
MNTPGLAASIRLTRICPSPGTSSMSVALPGRQKVAGLGAARVGEIQPDGGGCRTGNPIDGAGLPGRDNIRTPADLAKTAWLTATMRPDDWQRWLAKAGLEGLSPARWVTFDHTNLALGAAMDGLGVAIATIYLIDGGLRANRLIAPFPELMAPDDGYYVLCRTGQENRSTNRKNQVLRAPATTHSAIRQSAT